MGVGWQMRRRGSCRKRKLASGTFTAANLQYTTMAPPLPERDLTNPELIEKSYFMDTIPIEFVERVAVLT